MLNFINNYSTVITLIFSFLVTISTIVYACLTKELVKETIKMRRRQSDPNLLLNITHDENDPFIILIILSNIGGSIARNISFNVLKEPNLKKDKKLSTYHFITNGIDSIAPNTKIKTMLYSSIDEGVNMVEELIELQINYEDINGNKYSENCIFDLSYLKDFVIIKNDPLNKINSTLNEINKKIKKIDI